MDRIAEFFASARERHAIYLRRAAGLPPPWTEDPIFQQYRFCNVFRERDKTTAWFREHVRDPLRDTPSVLLATVLFRLFNRITTGEALFIQPDFMGQTAFEAWADHDYCDTSILRAAVLQYCSPGPYVTGSYIIKTPDGYDKLDGVLKIVEWFCEGRHKDGETHIPWRDAAEICISSVSTLESMWDWLRGFPYIGHFTAYEIVSDLRHTALLDRAPDVMQWANPGPGCQRGLRWVFGDDLRKADMLPKMRELLTLSQSSVYWPRETGSVGPCLYTLAKGFIPTEGVWPAWEMREVEHWLCEFDKHTRTANGGPPPRQRMRYA